MYRITFSAVSKGRDTITKEWSGKGASAAALAELQKHGLEASEVAPSLERAKRFAKSLGREDMLYIGQNNKHLVVKVYWLGE